MHKKIPDLVVGDVIYFCQRWWSVIAIKPIAGPTKQTCLTLKAPYLTIKQAFDDTVFVSYKEQKPEPQKTPQQEFTRKEVIDWMKKTRTTFENFETLQMKRRRHSLKKRGQNDNS